MKPLVSVVMSTYNREQLVALSVESVLEQTFDDFEFIIIDDASMDNTVNVIKDISDSRIKLIQNKENKGCTFNYHVAQNLAKGKYIAHLDDDDIWLPQKLSMQVDYLANSSDIVLVGSFIETFGENQRPSWIFYDKTDKIEFSMNFYNPMCHSSILYDKNFMERNLINYNLSCKCSQDYDFYKQIILKSGKISNIPEILVKYRMHSNRITDVFDTQQVQINVAENVKKELLSRYFNEFEYSEFSELIRDFPYNNYDKASVVKVLETLKRKASEHSNIKQKSMEEIIFDVENNLFVF